MILYDLASKMGDFVYFAKKKMADFAWFCMILHFSNSVYIMSGQTFTKNAKNGQFLASFWNPEACGQTVLPDGSIYRDKNWWKMPKVKNSNATFWAIFKQYVSDAYYKQNQRGTSFWKNNEASCFIYPLLVLRICSSIFSKGFKLQICVCNSDTTCQSCIFCKCSKHLKNWRLFRVWY